MQHHRWICSSVTPSVLSCQQRQNLNKRETQRGKSSSVSVTVCCRIFDLGTESQRIMLPVCKLLTLSLLSFLSLFGFSFCCVSSFLWPLLSPSQCFFGFFPLLGLFLQPSQAWCRSVSVNLTYSTLHLPPTRTLLTLSLLQRLKQKPADIYSHIHTLESQIC